MKNRKIFIISAIFVSILFLQTIYHAKDLKEYTYEQSNNYDYTDSKIIDINGNQLIQKIHSKYNNLNKIQIYLDPTDQIYDESSYIDFYTSVSLSLELKDNNAKTIDKYKYEKVYFKRKIFITFEFKPIKNSKNKTYYLYLTTYKNENLPIRIAKYNNNDSYNLLVNKKPTDKSIVYDTSYKIIKLPGLYYIILTGIPILIFILLIFLPKKWQLEKKYLLLSLIFGSLFLLVTPALQGNDELSHYFRTYEISNGKLISSQKDGWPATKVPSNVIDPQYKKYNQINKKINTNLSIKGYKYIDMQYTSVYSIISYIPQTIGMWFAKLITLNAFYWVYIVRIFQMVFSCLMIYYAIKITPFGKNIMLLIGLLPSIPLSTSTVSADAILISCFMLMLAKILEISYTKKDITKKDYIILTATSIAVAISKLVYVPLCLLLILIPLNRKDKKIKKNTIIILLVSFIITLLWNVIATSNLVSGQGINVEYYINYYLHKPLEFVEITIHTFIVSISNFISDLFGGRNYWFGTRIDDASFVPVVLFIAFILCVVKGENKLNDRDKKIIGIILLITYLLISTSLLLTCTPVHSKEIMGIQGRYFIPFLPLIYLVFSKNKTSKINTDYITYIVILVYMYFIFQPIIAYM